MRILSIFLIVVACIATGCLPFFFPNVISVSPVQHILLVIFVAAALSWLLEPIPVYATSLVIMGALAFLISDSAFTPLKEALLAVDSDHLVKYKDILHSFSSPIIILFLGGFALAIGATKYKLDINLASILLKPFGTKPKAVMLGLMCITAIFGMFMSNTATTVMMLAMVAPVLAVIDSHDKGIKGLVLSVPFSANIGGIATPIGTPPNAIALSYLTNENSIGFLQWMIFGFPIAAICIFLSWIILNWMFPFQGKEIRINIESKFASDWQSIVVYATFALTILMWMTERWHGINSYVVALIPLLVFSSTGIIKASDIKTMNWDVIWLVAGGIALGDALGATGLAAILANIVDYSQFNNFTIIVVICLIGWIVSNFISSTATANLMIPITIAVFANIDISGSYSIPMVLMVVAITLSFGMSLPISTPPNALAYATGYIKNSDMLKAGGFISIVCFTLAILALYFFGN